MNIKITWQDFDTEKISLFILCDLDQCCAVADRNQQSEEMWHSEMTKFLTDNQNFFFSTTASKISTTAAVTQVYKPANEKMT